MTKQTKLIKFMLVVLILIPIALFSIAIVQTFVIKNKQNHLLQTQIELQQKQEELNNKNEIYEYKSSEEYKAEQFKHNQYNGQTYGNEGDINVTIK